MQKKIFLLSLLCGGIYLFDACCGDYKPYFDYKKLNLASDLLVLSSKDTVTTLRVSPAEVEYLASGVQPLFSTPAYGNSCPIPGDQGSKYKMSSIEILADQDFNDTLPAGTSLAPLFFNGRGAASTQPITQNLADLEFPGAEWDFVVYTPFKPKQPNLTFVMTVKITKTDGSVAIGKLGNVRFR